LESAVGINNIDFWRGRSSDSGSNFFALRCHRWMCCCCW
jgi:hypothetical protein